MKLTVFTVDDEKPIRDWINYCISLKGDKFQILGSAKNGKEAFDKVIELKPDVIVTDIQMPVMDGLELMEKVSPLLPYTVFIVLTNHAEFSYAQRAINYGATSYLLKSEMRSGDLTHILEGVLEKKIDIIQNKEINLAQDYMIDLFDIFQGKSTQEILDFWQRLGADLQKSYIVLTMSRSLWEHREHIYSHILTGNNTLVLYALHQGYLQIILQGDENLYNHSLSIGNFICKEYNCPVGIGVEHMGFGSSTRAVEEAIEALEMYFFKQENKLYCCSDMLSEEDGYNRKIQEHFGEIHSLFALKSYREVDVELEKLFQSVKSLEYTQVVWLKKQWINLYITIEQHCHNQKLIPASTSDNLMTITTLQICMDRIKEMLNLLIIDGGSGYSSSIATALDYIHQNYDKQINLVDIAKLVHRSPEYFSRMFKEEVGENISVYIIMYRLKKARTLILNTDKRIADIGYQVGYVNPGYFSRLYKKYMGINPDKERRLNK